MQRNCFVHPGPSLKYSHFWLRTCRAQMPAGPKSLFGHLKLIGNVQCPVTPSDEHDYKEDVAEASFQESRMEFSGPYFKKNMSFGPRKASRKALGHVLAFSIPKLPFCSVVASPHQSPWCLRLWPQPAQPSIS